MKTFDSIIGYQSIKDELYQIIDMFKNFDLYRKVGAKPINNLLLLGPCGTGKTSLAEALISECNVPYFILRKTEGKEAFIKKMNKTFDDASKLGQAIILCDDLDKYSESDETEVDDEVFVALQANIDLINGENIFIVGTCNNLRKLPASLRRTQRFDRKIMIGNPSLEDGRKIIEYYLSDKVLDESVKLDDVAKMINYTSCSDLQTIINESAIQCVYRRKEKIDMDDIIKAYLNSKFTNHDETFTVRNNDLDIISIHEAGHAAIAEILMPEIVGFVTISTGGNNTADGFTSFCKDIDRRPHAVMVALGGKAASEVFFEGKCASGTSSDLERSYDLLYSGITNSGTLGLDKVCNDERGATEDLRSNVEKAVHNELERYYFLTKSILLENKELVLKIWNKLKEKTYLLASDMKEIVDSTTIKRYEII